MKKGASMSPDRKGQDVAVIGLGQFGSSVARRLEALGRSVLGIDQDPARAKSIAPDITETLILDATNESALEEADIPSYSTAIVAISRDFEAAALVTAALKGKGVDEVISMATDHRHREILLQIGADRVVLPMEESGLRLADELSSAGSGSAMPLSAGYSIAQHQISSETELHTVEDCEAEGVSVLALLHEDQLVLAPQTEQRLEAGDLLVLMGKAGAVARFAGLL
jgi:trk system potassium uptake protein TrkA